MVDFGAHAMMFEVNGDCSYHSEICGDLRQGRLIAVT
jgi:hypothetical protein